MAKTVLKLKTSESETLTFADKDIISIEWEQQSTSDHSTAIYDLYAVYGQVVLQDNGLVLYKKAISGGFDDYKYPLELYVNNTKVGSFVVTELPSYSYADKTLTLTFGDRLSVADDSIYNGYDYSQPNQTLDVIFKAVLKAFDNTLSDNELNAVLAQSKYSSTQTFAQYFASIAIPYPYIAANNSFRTAFKQILTVAQAALITDSEIGYRLVRMDGNKAYANENSIAILSDKTTSQLTPTVILPNKYNVCDVEAKTVADEFKSNSSFTSKTYSPNPLNFGEYPNSQTVSVPSSRNSNNYNGDVTAAIIDFESYEKENASIKVSFKQNNGLTRLTNEDVEGSVTATKRLVLKKTMTIQELVKVGGVDVDKTTEFDTEEDFDGLLNWGGGGSTHAFDGFRIDKEKVANTNNEWGNEIIVEEIVEASSIAGEESFYFDGSHVGFNNYTGTTAKITYTVEENATISTSSGQIIAATSVVANNKSTCYGAVFTVKDVNLTLNYYGKYQIHGIYRYKISYTPITISWSFYADYFNLTFKDTTVTRTKSGTITSKNKVTISGGGTLMQDVLSTPATIATNTLEVFENGLNGGTLECSAGDYYAFSGIYQKLINYTTTNESNASTKYKKFFAVGDMVVPCKDRNYTPIMTRAVTDNNTGETTAETVYFQVVKNSITFNGGSYSQQLTLREVK